MPELNLPYVPEEITIHLGLPESNAENITVPFVDYIKNVASSEIYPTWPESAIRANVLAQISYALNRVYTEYYRSRGYDFDITNTTQLDQAYVRDRETFDNVNKIVDDIFNNYIVRQGAVEPLFAQFCNGTTATCNGLSQWGSVQLAEEGLIPYEILQNYYGDNINIVENAPVRPISDSYEGVPLRFGDSGDNVRTIQIQLNRIRNNYPSIPAISNVDGTFGPQTEAAVREFQRIFNLTADGIVGKATWYRIKNIFNGVKKLNDLSSEGLNTEDVQQFFPDVLRLGDTGVGVTTLQYYLAVIGYFNDNLPESSITGTFDQGTYNDVVSFQRAFSLTPDGIVGPATWEKLSDVYQNTVASVPLNYEGQYAAIYPGVSLNAGSSGENVRKIQIYLARIAESNPAVPSPEISGYFGDSTVFAVRAFQREYGISETGVVGAVTWAKIADEFNNLV